MVFYAILNIQCFDRCKHINYSVSAQSRTARSLTLHVHSYTEYLHVRELYGIDENNKEFRKVVQAERSLVIHLTLYIISIINYDFSYRHLVTE